MGKLKFMLLVIAANLHQHAWGKCASEDVADTAVNLSCSNDDEDLVSEVSYLQYRSQINKVNILLDSVHNHPMIAKTVLKELFAPVVTLTVTNTLMQELDEALVLANVSELTINDCSLTKIKFDDILILKQATKLNISHNSISVLKSAELGNEQQVMHTIDLSHNLISNVPDNCFTIFSHLKHLNLSHNSISHLSVAAFEGISQLESLYLSYNKLSSIENIATKLTNLEILYLDYNYISNIGNMNSMTLLQDLNLAQNEIKFIEENDFEAMSYLKTLDLTGNQIRGIPVLKNNNNIRELRLTDNKLKGIINPPFVGKRFSKIFINGNKDILLINIHSVNCEYLDMSNCGLQYLNQNAFNGSMLRSINLTNNVIFYIGVSTFFFVTDLEELDLSNNALKTLDFLNSGVNSLKKLMIKSNLLSNISNGTFVNFPSLQFLDLSYNAIKSIETDAFIHLKQLEHLLLNNNRIFSIQILNLQGMSALVQFDLSYTEIGNFTQAAVPGLKTTTFNCSHAELFTIHFDTFAEVEHIEILDLSYNSLTAFEVNPKGMSSVESLYLNNNKIISVSNISFSGFMELRVLQLEFNNIVNIHPKAFSPLKSLRILNLSDNRDLQITGNVFSDLRVLVSLIIINNKKSFDFQHTENTSIDQVDLSLCDIDDLGSLHIYNIKGVVSLNLSKNLIGYIDKKSFKTMPKLMLLDISFNLIKSIEPGSFINTKSVSVLNLHRNQLSDFQHGVFQGLAALQKLNLSNNLLHKFNANLLHNCAVLKEISIENNFITNLELRQFVTFLSMKKFYLGGNNISCHDIASYKKYLYDGYNQLYTVASETPNYHTDNVDGITCIPNNNTGNNDINDTMNTSYISKFTDSLEKIRKAIDNFNQEYYVKGIFNILIVILVALSIFLVVKYVPIQRLFLILRKPLNSNLSHNCSYNSTQRISNDDL